jgi:hypothetical protein
VLAKSLRGLPRCACIRSRFDVPASAGFTLSRKVTNHAAHRATRDCSLLKFFDLVLEPDNRSAIGVELSWLRKDAARNLFVQGGIAPASRGEYGLLAEDSASY